MADLLYIMPLDFYRRSFHAQLEWIIDQTPPEKLPAWAAALEALIDAAETVRDAVARAGGDGKSYEVLCAVSAFNQRNSEVFRICPYSDEYEAEIGREVVLEALRARLAG